MRYLFEPFRFIFSFKNLFSVGPFLEAPFGCFRIYVGTWSGSTMVKNWFWTLRPLFGFGLVVARFLVSFFFEPLGFIFSLKYLLFD